MSSLRSAIEECDGVSAVAKQLGVSAQRLSNWIDRGVPVEECAALEIALGGKVTRREMRPNDWSRIWPELAGDEPTPSGNPPPPPPAGIDQAPAAVGG